MRHTPDQIIKKLDSLKSERGIWETHWQECADYNVPRKNQFIKRNVAGEKKGIELYDNTSMVSLETLVAALHGLLTNANTQWFQLQTGDEFLDDQDHIIKYLQGLTRRMHRIINNTNFQPEIYEYFVDLAAFGTAVMTVEEDDESFVRFSTKPLGDVFIEENNKGMIDEVYRPFKWNARQIIEEFASDVKDKTEATLMPIVGEKVTKAFMKGESEKFEVIHAVYKDFDHKFGSRPFLSQYVLRIDKKDLSEGRFKRFPYLVSRWSKTSGEVYGRSPAMTALPEAKTLNVMSKTTLKGAQKVVDPPLQMPDDGVVRPLRTAPGSVNYYRAGTTDRIEPIFNDSRIDFGYEAQRERQIRVREAFFVDKLNLAGGDRMTTAEVNQRIQEQLRFLGPLVGRQQPEFLKPFVDLIIDLMIMKDKDGSLLGDIPPELEDVQLDVVYSSPVARAQRVSEAEAIAGAMNSIAPIFELKPEAIDNIEADAYVREHFKIFGASQKVLTDRAKVEQIRESRQQAQQQAVQQQQQAAQMESAGQAATILKE